MREIKFRAFDAPSGQMYFSTERSGYDELYFDFTKYGLRLMRHMDEDYPEETKSPIMQFTGLKDKNGVDIYEGDIVLSKYTVQNYTQEDIGFNPRFHNVPMYKEVSIKGIVVYDPAIFRLADKNGIFIGDGYPDWDLLEVIGNIHQNPELL